MDRRGHSGAYRFLRRLWNFITEREEWLRDINYTAEELRKVSGKTKELRRIVHETLEGYLTDMERRYQLNTAIAKVMKLLNELTAFDPETEEERKALREGVDVLLKLLAPITPTSARSSGRGSAVRS
ncbi:MAG: class I tRNA ligase family protein [Aquificota bacterium]|nr:class I tRNA ligase family protein [Aquificota bacterium]